MSDDTRNKKDPSQPIVRDGPTPVAGGEEHMPAPPHSVQEIFAAFGQFGGSSRSRLLEKVTGEHITEMLSIQRESLKHDREDQTEDRKHSRVILFTVALFVLILVGMLLYSGNPQLTERVLTALISLIAGAVGGYGYGKSRSD